MSLLHDIYIYLLAWRQIQTPAMEWHFQQIDFNHTFAFCLCVINYPLFVGQLEEEILNRLKLIVFLKIRAGRAVQWRRERYRVWINKQRIIGFFVQQNAHNP